MKETKFRAWDTEDLEWIYAEPVYGIFPSIPVEGWTESRYGDIQQYTGLHDKIGREIYEGDILESNALLGNSQKTRTTDIYAGASFLGNGLLSNEKIYMHNHQPEVIGNIYENPELLED